VIEDFYNTTFTLSGATQTKTDGRLVTTYTSKGSFLGAVFSRKGDKTVKSGKKDYIVFKTVYCDISVPVVFGDKLVVDGFDMLVVSIVNTNNENHHLVVDLTYLEIA
jgi:hypothetical protein